MREEEFIELINQAVRPLGARADEAEDYREPSLSVLGYWSRGARLHPLPFFGRSLSLVILVRQPVDVDRVDDYAVLMKRIGQVVNARFPPWKRNSGLSVALTTIVTTPEPIVSTDEETLAKVLRSSPTFRVVPLGLVRVNLGQEAIAFALADGPAGVYSEPTTIVDALTLHFRRFVPFVTG
jgi:hypothetical protein